MTPIEVYSLSIPLGREVRVRSRRGLFRVAKTIGKPVLFIKAATTEHMGVPVSEKKYNTLYVVDGDNIYTYREEVKKEE